jgi:hypothetical protein
MDNSYRIKANVGIDQVLNISLKQDIDIYEVLSLKLRQENLYKLHSADYGVIVGRVLANDAFGVPNAKVTVFIPLSDVDKLRQGIRDIYPYNFVTDVDNRNVKFNTLPNYKRFDCHQEVGSFPKKQLVLDEDTVLEVYNKYYKYTTVTNEAGDYMIFGVPTGEQILHIDIDLSDIGILSQEPRDFIYKGYSPDLFESPTQFKKSTNLDNLVQLYNENVSVTVYPFWGDESSDEIAITRKDVNIQYKFEPTCVFLGSIVTDNSSVSISHECIPDANIGDASQLTTSKGYIEMIRKTPNGEVEEYQIKGNNLIDSDGTWCYQIPMNLDNIGTDEYGNIININDISKGIPTRTSVRFRISLDETELNNFNKHKARYLVPNNPDLNENSIKPKIEKSVIDKDDYYEFGSLTPDDCFRDLYWNKVYSVKGYIPRLQKSKYEYIENYLAIKGVNKKGASQNNILPFNRINLNLSIPLHFIFYNFFEKLSSDDFRLFFSATWNMLKSNSPGANTDTIIERIMDNIDSLGLDFYNDWLNGCLYFPSWYLQKDVFCECEKDTDETKGKLYLFNNCSIPYENSDLQINSGLTIYNDYHFKDRQTSMPFGSKSFYGGVIKKMITSRGDDVYYYSFGSNIEDVSSDGYYDYVRLFSTDIILLGSLKDCDIHGVPKIIPDIPNTTANVPPLGTYKPDSSVSYSSNTDNNQISFNGMNWGQYWLNPNDDGNIRHRFKYGTGLLFGMYASTFSYRLKIGPSVIIEVPVPSIIPFSDLKTIPNVERLCELGVGLDSDIEIDPMGDTFDKKILMMDGLITKTELLGEEQRSFFATLNQIKLIGTVEDKISGYRKYNLQSMYPNNFDGRLEEIAIGYTFGVTSDKRNKDYLDFRFGTNQLNEETPEYISKTNSIRHFYGYEQNDDVYPLKEMRDEGALPENGYKYAFPLYNNSFYFYFGLKQGSTAIEKFYEQFYSKCENINKSSFFANLKPRKVDGTWDIYVNVTNIKNYTIELYQYNTLIESKKITDEAGDPNFEGLNNGRYTIKVIDEQGNSVIECIRLKD